MIIHKAAHSLSSPPLDLLRGASLFLDFDGTLVSIAARPDVVAVEAHLVDLIKRLRDGLRGRLAIVSGRAAADIGTLLADAGIVISASHGAELYRPGERTAPRAMAFGAANQALLEGLCAAHPGVLLEPKPTGLALHYRQAPLAESDCRNVAVRIAANTGLAVQPGKMVIELRRAGTDKGTALNALMRQPPLSGGRPIFIGDDETDEAGFAAAAGHGGAGILVGEPRATGAGYGLPDVDGTLAWLEAALEAAA